MQEFNGDVETGDSAREYPETYDELKARVWTRVSVRKSGWVVKNGQEIVFIGEHGCVDKPHQEDYGVYKEYRKFVSLRSYPI